MKICQFRIVSSCSHGHLFKERIIIRAFLRFSSVVGFYKNCSSGSGGLSDYDCDPLLALVNEPAAT